VFGKCHSAEQAEQLPTVEFTENDAAESGEAPPAQSKTIRRAAAPLKVLL